MYPWPGHGRPPCSPPAFPGGWRAVLLLSGLQRLTSRNSGAGGQGVGSPLRVAGHLAGAQPCACPHVGFRASPVSGWQPPQPEGPEGLEPPASQPGLGRAFLQNGQAGCWLGRSPESVVPEGSSGEARSGREAAP